VFIVIALIIVALIMIVSHNIRTVKKNQYRIGVYKSMGCPSKVFVLSCFVDTALLVATTLISSTLCVLILNKYVNQILISSFSKFVSSNVISNFVFVSFSLPNLLIYVAVILVVSIISLLAPILYLRKLKPNLILNKAE
jgi:ABC-type antimicrobial peptide transport system permease subunit